MDQYSVFFTFYGLILGLAVTEILSNFSAYGRRRLMRTIEPQSALLAALTFLVICATWIDAWTTRADFGLSFSRMWAPIGAATSYFLAASAVLPKDESDYDDMAAYFMRRKAFVVGMLILAELFIKVTYLPTYSRLLATTPAVFWLLSVPLNIAIFIAWLTLLLARKRSFIIAAALAQIFIFTVPYWSIGWISTAIERAYGYAS